MLHSRRLRSTLFAGMVAALGATTSLAPARAQPASAPGDQGPPNILFVLVDDMGYGDLSIMGNTKIETPNLDKLAREGVLMTKRSEEHTSELQSLMRISYAVFCLKKKNKKTLPTPTRENKRQDH